MLNPGKMKKFFLIVIFLFSASLIFAGGKTQTSGALTINEGVLTVGMEIGYPPMEFYDIDGKTLLGFDVELAEAIAAALGLKAEFIDTSWDGIFAGVKSGRYDCVISSVTITEERLNEFNFSRPYINNAQVMVLQKGSNLSARTPYEAAGLQIAVQGETTSEKFLTGLAKNGLDFTMRRYDKMIDCFDELRFGRVDALICESVVANYYAGASSGVFDIVWEEDIDEHWGICFKKENDELSNAVDKILAGFFDDGTMEELSKKYFEGNVFSSRLDRNSTVIDKAKEIIGWFPALLRGAWITIALTLLSVTAGLFLGIFLALGKMSNNSFASKFCSGYIFFFRGTPLLIQLYFIYYGLPEISPFLTIQNRFIAAFAAFALNAAAYCAEIIRSAITSIGKGQFEASRALGLSYAQTMLHVVFPQSIRRLIPPVGNEFIMVLKDVSLVGMIAMTDITRAARSISSSSASALVYLPAMILYLIITLVFSLVFNKLEKRFSVYE